MNKSFFGDYPATILSYNKKNRTARVSIPTVTDGLDEGITATFAYPVGHDDKDTEIEILPGAECYVFFLQGIPSSPVIWSYRSHGSGAVVDHRRIRQENIELLARVNIKAKAKTIEVDADTTVNIHGATKINLTSEAEISLSAPKISLNGA